MAMLLGLWYAHVVNRTDMDYSVSLEIMLTIMKGLYIYLKKVSFIYINI